MLAALAVCLLAGADAGAQFDFTEKKQHITFTASVAPADPFSELNQPKLPDGAKMAFPPGETFLVTVTGTPEPGWYTYPVTQRSAKQPDGQLGKLTIEAGENLQPIWPITETAPKWKFDKDIGAYLIHDQPFTWAQEVYLKPTAPAGKTITVPIKLRVQVCKEQCIWETHTLEVPVAVADGKPVAPSPELEKRLAMKPPLPAVVPVPPEYREKGGDTKTAEPVEKGGKPALPTTTAAGAPKVPAGLLGSILTAIAGGLISLLTPCVFPMIPITVSFFLKQSESGQGRTLTMAAVYSGTIVLVLTLGGLVLLRVLVVISQHYITNFLLGAIFLFFALSLLGWYDITLPSWLQDFTSSREEKGGVVGVFFMALTFSIISFACVGPIYGAFITLEATGQSAATQFVHKFLSVFAFSAAFASPFFLLALFPSLLRTMPRAGSWMNSVKVVMGFLELAAVFKFLRAGELYLMGKAELLTFDLSLGIYVALAIACGLYLLGIYRLPHDHEVPESIGVPRLLFSLTFISLGFYLLPGLFKNEEGESQRPRGEVYAWVESFLLTDVKTNSGGPREGGSNGQARSNRLYWHHKLDDALAEAKRQQKLLFIDFTGVT
jgi:thiol:disulfide interchange protein DsbD